MKISVLTTITNPEERQDKWREALACYADFADEIIIVNGGEGIPSKLKPNSRLNGLMLYAASINAEDKIKEISLPWPNEWNWVELPRHLNAGREVCTGDWIIKLDIDQLFHEDDLNKIRVKLAECPQDCQVATFQKMSMTYGKKYYQKGGQPIAFRNEPDIVIGNNAKRKTDLCFAVRQTGTSKVSGYDLPIGDDLKPFKTGIKYWNYDYFFKTEKFTKKEFWRFSRAYHRFWGKWSFGSNEKESFEIFLTMMKGRHGRAPYTYELEDHPKYIRKAVENLIPEQFGFNAWGLLK